MVTQLKMNPQHITLYLHFKNKNERMHRDMAKWENNLK